MVVLHHVGRVEKEMGKWKVQGCIDGHRVHLSGEKKRLLGKYVAQIGRAEQAARVFGPDDESSYLLALGTKENQVDEVCR